MYPIASTFTSQSAGSVLLDGRDITGLRPDRTLNDYGVVYSTNPVTWGRKPGGGFNCDRCCLVIRVQKVKPFAPNFDCYVERIDCPTAPQHPHRGRDCQCASVAKVVIGERKNNGSELDGPGLLRRWEGYHSTQSPRRPATGLLVDEDGIRT